MALVRNIIKIFKKRRANKAAEEIRLMIADSYDMYVGIAEDYVSIDNPISVKHHLTHIHEKIVELERHCREVMAEAGVKPWHEQQSQ